MTFVFRQLAGTYNYSYSVTDDIYGNIFPIPSMKNQKQSEPELTVYRTRTEHENISKYTEQEQNRTVITKEPKQYTNPIFWFFPTSTKADVGLYSRSQWWTLLVSLVCDHVTRDWCLRVVES